MVINEHTPTMLVLPYLDEAKFNELLEKCDPVPLDKSLFTMTVGELFDVWGDEDYVLRYFNERYIMDALGKIKTYRAEQEAIATILGQNAIKENADVAQAKFGVVFPSAQEEILVELCSFFGLKSLEEAGNVKVAEWLIVHRHNSAKNKLEHNLNKIQQLKQERKRNGR